MIERIKIKLIICLDSALIPTVWDEVFTNDAIIENDKEEVIINNLALVSFFMNIIMFYKTVVLLIIVFLVFIFKILIPNHIS